MPEESAGAMRAGSPAFPTCEAWRSTLKRLANLASPKVLLRWKFR
jgi:hypothetical protein